MPADDVNRDAKETDPWPGETTEEAARPPGFGIDGERIRVGLDALRAREADSVSGTSFEALLAEVIERARTMRDEASSSGGGAVEGRSIALALTHLETAALWYCNYRAQLHLGENALTDWLLEI